MLEQLEAAHSSLVTLARRAPVGSSERGILKDALSSVADLMSLVHNKTTPSPGEVRVVLTLMRVVFREIQVPSQHWHLIEEAHTRLLMTYSLARKAAGMSEPVAS